MKQLGALVAVTTVLLSACQHNQSRAHGKRVIVLGVDGMDPSFVEEHFPDLPNLRRLRALGGLTRLGTTTPPQSPVAWSSFITGMDPVEDGIFDFVHRDPATYQPYSSMGEVVEPAHQLRIGPYQLPLSKAQVRSFRRGRTFWEILDEHGIPATVIRIPMNYPPVDHGQALAGMGVPDLQGTFGTFTYYTDDPETAAGDVSGGHIVNVSVGDGRAILPIEGPPNTLRQDHRPVSLDLVVDVDPQAAVMRCRVGSQQFILKQGEWSPWIRVRFPLVRGFASVGGMFRLYARELHPGFRIYRSPLNIDPSDAALPISAPASYSRDVASRLGAFYTQGIEEDTSALRQGALDLPEYLSQSALVVHEHSAMLHDALDHYRDGLLFFYLSEVDQNSHVLWNKHPDELLETYRAVDRDLGAIMDYATDSVIIVMSDHGFASFDWAVNLNTWLMRQGFLALDDPVNAGPDPMFAHVDWHRTKAYAMGLNALYVNLEGREKNGIVKPGSERDFLLADLTAKLRLFRDLDGSAVIADVSRIDKPGDRAAPDLIIGYARRYRASWETALGGVPLEPIVANNDPWLADHCIAAAEVPGVLMGTRMPRVADPQLKDLTITILHEFSVKPDEAMKGRLVY